MGVKIKYRSRDALGKVKGLDKIEGNHYNIDREEIHLTTGELDTSRGVFLEEVQQALDDAIDPYWNQPMYMNGNYNLHKGTFFRITRNPWFRMTDEERLGFLNWQGGLTDFEIEGILSKMETIRLRRLE